MRWWSKIAVVLVMVGGLTACFTVMPNLSVTPSATAPGPRLEMTVALIAGPSLRTPISAHEIQGTCISGGMVFAPADYGELLLNSLRDRLQRQYAQVLVAETFDQATDADAIFEVAVTDAGYRWGCLIAPQELAQITASFKAMDGNGREIWRSGTTKGEQFKGMTTSMDFNREVGEAFSQAIGKLADRWVDELRVMRPSQYAAYGDTSFDVATQPARPVTRQAAAPARPSRSRFPTQPIRVVYPEPTIKPDDIGVIIGNADYGKMGADIPDVVPALADAEGFKRFLTEGKGLRPGNIIDLRDATGAQMIRVFGSATNPKGQLADWVKPGRSRVWVYYAGHGAPAGDTGTPYLVPVDADAARIDLNGYPLDVLYRNLAQIRAKSVTVVLEACFSGASEAGAVISNASPVFLKAKTPPVPAGITVIAAGGPNQMASWEEDRSHGLFTKYFLKGMAGEADKPPYGNGDKTVGWKELDGYLKDTVTYYARRYYGRDQTAVIAGGR